MIAACRPLHPDVPALVREVLLDYGLLPEELAGPAGGAPLQLLQAPMPE